MRSPFRVFALRGGWDRGDAPVLEAALEVTGVTGGPARAARACQSLVGPPPYESGRGFVLSVENAHVAGVSGAMG